MQITKKFFEAPLPFAQSVKGKKSEHLTFARLMLENKWVDLLCFPGFSNFSLEETCQDFIDLVTQMHPKELSQMLKKPFEITHTNPHVEHGLFQLYAQDKQSAAIVDKSNPKLTISHLVKNLSELGALMNIKLKISSDSEKFLTLAKQLSHYCTANPLLKFRLDANQSLSTQELEQYFSIIEELDLVTHLDYFEEPLKNHLDYLGLKANIPYALEESLDQYLKDKKHYKPQALVYKPSQQGLSKLSKLLKGEDREKVVISSCFDPLYAYEATTLLAREFPSKAHGLGAKTREEDISLSKKKALL